MVREWQSCIGSNEASHKQAAGEDLTEIVVKAWTKVDNLARNEGK